MPVDDPIAAAFAPVDDPLGEALHSLRMSGTFYCRSDLSAPWGVAMPAFPDCLMFHLITEGSCWVDVPGTKSCLLRAGDFALVPHGRGHDLRSGDGVEIADLFDLPQEQLSERYGTMKVEGTGERTIMICGAVQFEHPAAKRVVGMLPRIITMEANRPESEWMISAIRFMMAEAQAMRPGGDTIITRVSDILVIQAIRSWLDNDEAAKAGWLGALQDKQIGRAIALVHRDPMHPWTVASLAETIGMSRSAFAARFMDLVGEPPMTYVRRWRMNVAVTYLKESDTPIADLADRLGYQSEAAFNRAFKKYIGTTPGRVRRDQAA